MPWQAFFIAARLNRGPFLHIVPSTHANRNTRLHTQNITNSYCTASHLKKHASVSRPRPLFFWNSSCIRCVTYRVWNPKTGSCDAVLSGHRGTIGALCIISRPIYSTTAGCGGGDGGQAEASQGEVIVSGSGDATVRLWGRADRSGTNTAEWACLAILKGHRWGAGG